MPKIRVTRPFVFTHSHWPAGRPGPTGDPNVPATAPAKMPTTRQFTVGEHEVDDDTFNHPWIKDGADGAIADPQTAGEFDAVAKAQQDVTDAQVRLADAQAKQATAAKIAADKADAVNAAKRAAAEQPHTPQRIAADKAAADKAAADRAAAAKKP